MTGGIPDDAMVSSNYRIVIGSNCFKFPRWTSERFDVAMIFGKDLPEVVRKRKVAQIVFDNKFTIPDTVTQIQAAHLNTGAPSNYLLSQNFPNPFNPSTTISFAIPSRSFVTLKIFDVMGQDVATIASEELQAGSYSRRWNASGVSSAVYFYRLQAGSYSETKRLILLR